MRVDVFALPERYITMLLQQARFVEADDIAIEASAITLKAANNHWMTCEHAANPGLLPGSSEEV